MFLSCACFRLTVITSTKNNEVRMVRYQILPMLAGAVVAIIMVVIFIINSL